MGGKEMKITIVYDNESYGKGLQADWGFSCLVEVENTPKILFDTGANGEILLSNMERLHIDPQAIEEVFISHGHFDHIGGLSAFLKVNSDVKLYVPVSVVGAVYGGEGDYRG
jgi:7,8-dihydropterin-6-yl-methyl-4-(beta-D-ribofuranosyl)aminobenzene 5'-phosphate synthase